MGPDESTPAEDRVVILETAVWSEVAEGNIRRFGVRCVWRQLPVKRHSAEAKARCDAAYDAEIARRRVGPTRISDLTRSTRDDPSPQDPGSRGVTP